MTPDRICVELEELAARGAELDRLLSRAVELLHEISPRFHWTGIYELYPDGMLRLGPFAGDATDHAFIAEGEGICGAAVSERRNVNIPDVSRIFGYPASATPIQSELVVLIRDGDRIFGHIDIDSHEKAAFNHEAVRRVERVADVLARIYERRE